jgi:hypothetical protein
MAGFETGWEIDSWLYYYVLTSRKTGPCPFRNVNMAPIHREEVDIVPRLMVKYFGEFIRIVMAVPSGKCRVFAGSGPTGFRRVGEKRYCHGNGIAAGEASIGFFTPG